MQCLGHLVITNWQHILNYETFRLFNFSTEKAKIRSGRLAFFYELFVEMKTATLKSIKHLLKGTIKAPKMQPVYFASVLKLTENYSLLNYNSLYRVRLAIVVNKSGFVRPETWSQNWQHYLKRWRGNHSNLPKTSWQIKTLLVDQKQPV